MAVIKNHEAIARHNIMSDGVFGDPVMFVSDEMTPSIIFPDFTLNLTELFPPKEEIIVEVENRL